MAIEVERARRLWSVDEYLRMVEAGILTDRDHVELIHGEIVQMTPIGRRHGAAHSVLVTFFSRGIGDRAVIWSQGSLALPPRSMPEPDVMVLKPRRDHYRTVDVRPEDVLLVIEVADSSLRYDRLIKMPLYAAAGIPEAWVVDVDGGRIETYRQPGPTGYVQVETFERGASVAPLAFPDLLISVSDVVG